MGVTATITVALITDAMATTDAMERAQQAQQAQRVPTLSRRTTKRTGRQRRCPTFSRTTRRSPLPSTRAKITRAPLLPLLPSQSLTARTSRWRHARIFPRWSVWPPPSLVRSFTSSWMSWRRPIWSRAPFRRFRGVCARWSAMVSVRPFPISARRWRSRTNKNEGHVGLIFYVAIKIWNHCIHSYQSTCNTMVAM